MLFRSSNNSFDNYKDPAEINPNDDNDSTSCYEDDDDICDCEDCNYCRLKSLDMCGDPYAFEAYGNYPVFDDNGIQCGDIDGTSNVMKIPAKYTGFYISSTSLFNKPTDKLFTRFIMVPTVVS